MKKLFDKFKIKPKNMSLYIKAFTHKSFANENNLNYSYERLEFLGDAVINKIVCQYLFENFYVDEGQMTKYKIAIVQSSTLARAAKSLNFKQYIKIGQSLSHQEISDNIYEDVFEAFIGATYLDQGEKKAKEILINTIIGYLIHHQLDDETKDYKTMFQEAMQKFGKKEIIYQSKKINNDEFLVELICNNIKYGIGKGKQLKIAEKMAAKDACHKMIMSTKEFE